MNNILAAYAMDFVAFVTQNTDKKDMSCIRKVVLFGSVARGDTRPKSDVDIFFDVMKNSIETKILELRERFYDSEYYKRYWRLIGVNNTIKPIVGKLDEWKDLKTSIIADGIILYSKYADIPETKNLFVLVWWESVKNQTKRVILSRNLYGWNSGKKKYIGLLEKLNGRKLGANSIIVPLENFAPVSDLFRRHKIDYMSMHVNEMK